jgi:hypothetical protein
LSKEVGLEVKTEKTKYVLLSHHQNARENHDIKIGTLFRKCGIVKILVFGNDHNESKPIQEEIKRRLNYRVILYPCGGEVKYLHRDPASRKRQRNGTKKRPRHSLSG